MLVICTFSRLLLLLATILLTLFDSVTSRNSSSSHQAEVEAYRQKGESVHGPDKTRCCRLEKDCVLHAHEFKQSNRCSDLRHLTMWHKRGAVPPPICN